MPYAMSEKSLGSMLVISSMVLGKLFITPSCCILALSVSFSIDMSSYGIPYTLLHMRRIVDFPDPAYS